MLARKFSACVRNSLHFQKIRQRQNLEVSFDTHRTPWEYIDRSTGKLVIEAIEHINRFLRYHFVLLMMVLMIYYLDSPEVQVFEYHSWYVALKEIRASLGHPMAKCATDVMLYLNNGAALRQHTCITTPSTSLQIFEFQTL